jgi:Fic family protein
MEKITITERINGINFETLTEEDFNFLVERALKSVRKTNGVRKPTKNQVANEGLKAEIRNALGEGTTATDAGKAVGISVQKASALLKQMVDAGEVVKVKDGKATIFKVA